MFLGVPKSIVVRLGWMSVGYGGAQLLRLANNVILARLLAPPIFGLMAVVNSIRTGVELLSDVGIMQNIVSNPRGDHPDFYDTAWTLQAVRGVVLAAICMALAVPLARFFEYPELAAILPVASLFFVFTGFDSTARPLIQKQLQVARINLFDIGIGVVSLVAHVVLAILTPTVWALVLGSVITGAATLIGSFLFIPGMRHRFMIDPESARQLLKFGKWVFLSSIVYFFAMNFDRLYFAKVISLSELGVYGIARSLADMVSLFVARASNFVLFPTVAAAGLAPPELRQKLLHGRRTLLLAAAVILGSFLAISGIVVDLLYDQRYQQAGLILPVLCVGVWFGILTSTNDSILMGLARPAYPALSNTAKLISYLIGVPLAFHYFGFMGAVAVISLGEIVKYAALWMLSHKEHLHFGRDDLALTFAFAATALAIGEITRLLGIGGGIQGMIPQFLLQIAGKV
ncbi:oligosaccharide flippase family protein [Sphingomonas sediminicola]|jgi:O-antigen/teichoic acid export membrane protein|uniref:oligosaccharide flippase family protein n=2 Tax=Sphingomonas sediminicola TaxID=386874 RepID=UPI003CF31835